MLVLLLGAPLLAGADPPNQVQVGDLPGTNGRWQQGVVTVSAPPDLVQRWLTEAAQWPARFPDDAWARDLGQAPDGRRQVQFHSNVLGKTVTVRMDEKPGLIVYDGSGKGVWTQGKIFVEPAGRGTRVIMQTTGDLKGLGGALVPDSLKRKRVRKKLASDLNAVIQLSNTWAAASRRGG
jgi:hypothetical protein